MKNNINALFTEATLLNFNYVLFNTLDKLKKSVSEKDYEYGNYDTLSKILISSVCEMAVLINEQNGNIIKKTFCINGEEKEYLVLHILDFGYSVFEWKDIQENNTHKMFQEYSLNDSIEILGVTDDDIMLYKPNSIECLDFLYEFIM